MRVAGASLAAVAALIAAGCGTVGRSTSGDPSQGKALFLKNCGSCHTLSDAKTSGTIGPNLDDAFASDRVQGFKNSTIQDVVRGQIAYAEGIMPPHLVAGADADAVAAYVAKCAGLKTPCNVTAAKPPAAATPPTKTGGGGALVAQGQQLYASKGCQSCHSLDGSKSVGPTFKGLAGSQVKLAGGKSATADDAYLAQSIDDPDAQIAAGYAKGTMSSVIKPHSISDPNVKALVAFIKSLK